MLVNSPAAVSYLWLKTWQTLNHDSSRNISEGVITYVDSFVDLSTTHNILIQTYVLHHSGPLAAGDAKAKDLPTGKIWVLNLSVV